MLFEQQGGNGIWVILLGGRCLRILSFDCQLFETILVAKMETRVTYCIIGRDSGSFHTEHR